ncbi:MAG: hypothetical protein EXR75_04140 [Myxococcales bacterium]|nr:hypothetical protein [Myxococcales bacterium]
MGSLTVASVAFSSLAVASVVLGGCASTPEGPAASAITPIKAERRADGTIVDDHSLCDFKDRKDVELSETAGSGSMQPNVRRVYKVFGIGADRRKILVCREVDTNLDGIKDTVRLFTDEGQSKEERADTNFDGKIDTWNVFARGRLAEVRLDHNYDGKEDETKVYIEGKLSRVKRDTNSDGKPDTWEMYRNGRIERMGVDIDFDTRVDRWDQDTEWRRKFEEKERRKEKEAADKARDAAEKLGKETEGDASTDDAAKGDAAKRGAAKGDAAKGDADDTGGE